MKTFNPSFAAKQPIMSHSPAVKINFITHQPKNADDESIRLQKDSIYTAPAIKKMTQKLKIVTSAQYREEKSLKNLPSNENSMNLSREKAVYLRPEQSR